MTRGLERLEPSGRPPHRSLHGRRLTVAGSAVGVLAVAAAGLFVWGPLGGPSGGGTYVPADASYVTGAAVQLPPASSAEQAAAVTDATAFGGDLFGRLAGEDQNLVMSPSSLDTVLAMPAPGAHGDTAAQLLRMLHSDLTPDQLAAAVGAVQRKTARDAQASQATLSVANSLWTQRGYGLRPTYLGVLRDTHNGQVLFMGQVVDPTQAG
jgi:hypothetical protein